MNAVLPACVSTHQRKSHYSSVTALLLLILTFLLVIDDVFAKKIVVAKNDGGAQHRQALLEPHQFVSEGLEAGNLQSQPAGSTRQHLEEVGGLRVQTEMVTWGGGIHKGNTTLHLEQKQKKRAFNK